MRRVHLEEIDVLPALDGALQWKAVRHALGISAFGINAYVGGPGDLVVEEHEDDHQELYLVLRGSARFSAANEQFDAPAGTFVMLEPGERRIAHALEPGTAVLAIGAEGQRFVTSTWELGFRVSGLVALGQLEDASLALQQARAERPDWGFHYCGAQLAVAQGRLDVARAEVDAAVEADSSAAERAREDRLLAPLFGPSGQFAKVDT